MADVRQVMRVNIRGWMALGFWIWFPGALVVWLWVGEQVRLGWFRATVSVVGTWAIIVSARGLSALCLNALSSYMGGWQWIVREDQVVRVRVWGSLSAISYAAIPFGVLTGLMINLWGWVNVIPHHWVVVPVALWMAAEVYGILSLTFYNEIIVRFYGPVHVTCRRLENGETILLQVSATPLRRVTTMWYFLWLLCILTMGFLVAGVLLIMVARHVPAGGFGMEVGAFAFVLALFVSYLASVAIGWWYLLGAKCYAWAALTWVTWREETLGSVSQ